MHHSRSIYTSLDLFGDVGGLFAALKGIFSLVITLYFYIFGDPVHSYLFKALFLKDPETNEGDKIAALNSTDDKLEYLKMRTPFILPRVFCNCLRNRKGRNVKEKGLSRIDKELEIDKFL